MWNNWKRSLHFNQWHQIQFECTTALLKGNPTICHLKPTTQLERSSNNSDASAHQLQRGAAYATRAAMVLGRLHTHRNRQFLFHAHSTGNSRTHRVLRGWKVHTLRTISQSRVRVMLCRNSMREWFAYFVVTEGNRAGSRPTFERVFCLSPRAVIGIWLGKARRTHARLVCANNCCWLLTPKPTVKTHLFALSLRHFHAH